MPNHKVAAQQYDGQPLLLAKNEVHIWSRHLSIDEQQQAQDFALLNDEEQERTERFYFAKHQRRFIAARAGLRQLLSPYLNVLPNEIQFHYSEYGKPFLVDEQNSKQLCFNLSHSHELAIYAVTLKHAVGIDIEHTRQRPFLELAKRFFAPDEYQALMKLKNKDMETAFYYIWTQKEAFIKAISKGLYYPLENFTVTATKPAKLLSAKQHNSNDWDLLDIDVPKPYIANLATKQQVKNIQYWEL